MLDFSIEFRDPASLTVNPRRLRLRSEAVMQKLVSSVDLFGVLEPPLVTSDGEIVVGEGRVEAAVRRKMALIPTINVDHLSPAQRRAYRIAASRLAELAKWDEDMLALEMAELNALDLEFDLTVTGFDEAAIENFVRSAENDPVVEDDPSAFAEGVPVARVGQLWSMKTHRLWVGDALAASSFDALMANERARMILSDVPFNLKIPGVVSGLGRNKHDNFVAASGELSDAEYTRFLTTSFRLMRAHSVDGALAYTFIDFRHLLQLLRAGAIVFDELKSIITWDKGSGSMGSLYRNQSEFVAVFKSGTAPHTNRIQLGKNGRNRTTIWEFPGMNSFAADDRLELLKSHPTPKPIELLAEAILDVSTKGEIILDPFVGSGSTILAAEEVGRRCFSMELDPKYAGVALRRCRFAMGCEPILVATGQTLAELETIQKGTGS